MKVETQFVKALAREAQSFREEITPLGTISPVMVRAVRIIAELAIIVSEQQRQIDNLTCRANLAQAEAQQ